MSNFSHQDWTPVVLKKHVNPRKKITDYERANGVETIQTKKYGSGKNNQNFQSGDISKVQREAIDNDGLTKKIATVDKKISKNIQQARQAQKLTQKQLAQQVNQPVSVIQEYENGKAIPNAGLINKLERVLKTKLRNCNVKRVSLCQC